MELVVNNISKKVQENRLGPAQARLKLFGKDPTTYAYLYIQSVLNRVCRQIDLNGSSA